VDSLPARLIRLMRLIRGIAREPILLDEPGHEESEGERVEE
jgi:hypothetical protein